MKNVLVTGISGFVGSNLVRYFKNDAEIKLLGYGRKKIEEVKSLPDVNAKSLNENKIDVIIHLAGIAHDLSNQYKPEDYYRVNFENTKSLYEEFLKSDASKFIFVSSIKAALDVSSTSADESVQPNPVTDYGRSKRKAEECILSNSGSKKLFYILRPVMMHGAGNKGNLNLLYRFTKLGLPFPLGAFHNQRSFLSIDNFCFVVESLIKKEVSSGIYHLADEGFLSTTDLYKLISEAIGKKPSVWNVSPKLIEAFATFVGKKSILSKLTEDMMVSNKKMVNAIGTPLPVSLRDGLTKTIQSFDGK